MWQVNDLSFLSSLQQDCLTMSRRIVPSSMGLGLSIILFTFMFLPTFIILLAVVVFFLFAYPKLRGSSAH